MWNNVFFLTIILHILCFSTRSETYDNDTERKLLCKIFISATNVMKKYEENKILKETIYGTRGRALFNERGTVELPWSCGLSGTGRGSLYDYYHGGGCFADSLVGTFMCLCTHGGNSDSKNFCRLGNVGGVEIWSGWETKESTKDLFEKVWKKVRESCFKESRSSPGGEDDLRNLREVMKNVREQLRQGNEYFYLGGKEERSGCSGVNGDDVCVRCTGVSKDNAIIPWMKKIDGALEKL
ncbi:Variant surface glycoprotein [Trypanosoma congolense IL3000]|uniref:Variant surface glycoprotein n=1 Tax=Trypanosoma congolense (strain IL3000) TaxID=1068625 RepID=F9W9I5_TRYCI|nr:Variant surface glycoprotein [Trypanosoma congolense IL3000]